MRIVKRIMFRALENMTEQTLVQILHLEGMPVEYCPNNPEARNRFETTIRVTSGLFSWYDHGDERHFQFTSDDEVAPITTAASVGVPIVLPTIASQTQRIPRPRTQDEVRYGTPSRRTETVERSPLEEKRQKLLLRINSGDLDWLEDEEITHHTELKKIKVQEGHDRVVRFED